MFVYFCQFFRNLRKGINIYLSTLNIIWTCQNIPGFFSLGLYHNITQLIILNGSWCTSFLNSIWDPKSIEFKVWEFSISRKLKEILCGAKHHQKWKYLLFLKHSNVLHFLKFALEFSFKYLSFWWCFNNKLDLWNCLPVHRTCHTKKPNLSYIYSLKKLY